MIALSIEKSRCLVEDKSALSTARYSLRATARRRVGRQARSRVVLLAVAAWSGVSPCAPWPRSADARICRLRCPR